MISSNRMKLCSKRWSKANLQGKIRSKCFKRQLPTYSH